MHRSLAIVEHDPVWRHWLKRTLPQLPNVLGASFHSAPALLASNALCDVDLLIVAYRLPGIDAFSWINGLRQHERASSLRIIALVCGGDVTGRSMAVLAGADVAYRKGLDDDLLRKDLSRWVAQRDAVGSPSKLPSCGAQQPLFDPAVIKSVCGHRALNQRMVVLSFLEMLNGNIRSLRLACANKARNGDQILQDFALECRTVGALRAGDRTESLRCSVLDRGAQADPVILDYFDVLLSTAREMAEWCLDWAQSDA